MFITAYLFSLPLCSYFGFKFAKYAVKRLKEDGYIHNNPNNDIKKVIIDFVPYCLLPLIPLLNLLTIFISSKKNIEECYQVFKNALLDLHLITKTDSSSDVVYAVPVTKKDELGDEPKDTKKVATYSEAFKYWDEKELEKHECPTLPTMDELREQENNGFQKTIGRMK